MVSEGLSQLEERDKAKKQSEQLREERVGDAAAASADSGE